MASTIDDIADALVSALQTELTGATVLRNEAYPERVPSGGLVIVNDGDPGTPERLLGGFSEAFYTRTMEIHVLAQGVTSSDRDSTFSTLLAGIGDVIEADLTVGGRGGITNYSAPTSEVFAPDAGGAAVKAGTIFLTMEYETTSPLG